MAAPAAAGAVASCGLLRFVGEYPLGEPGAVRRAADLVLQRAGRARVGERPHPAEALDDVGQHGGVAEAELRQAQQAGRPQHTLCSQPVLRLQSQSAASGCRPQTAPPQTCISSSNPWTGALLATPDQHAAHPAQWCTLGKGRVRPWAQAQGPCSPWRPPGVRSQQQGSRPTVADAASTGCGGPVSMPGPGAPGSPQRRRLVAAKVAQLERAAAVEARLQREAAAVWQGRACATQPHKEPAARAARAAHKAPTDAPVTASAGRVRPAPEGQQAFGAWPPREQGHGQLGKAGARQVGGAAVVEGGAEPARLHHAVPHNVHRRPAWRPLMAKHAKVLRLQKARMGRSSRSGTGGGSSNSSDRVGSGCPSSSRSESHQAPDRCTGDGAQLAPIASGARSASTAATAKCCVEQAAAPACCATTPCACSVGPEPRAHIKSAEPPLGLAAQASWEALFEGTACKAAAYVPCDSPSSLAGLGARAGASCEAGEPAVPAGTKSVDQLLVEFAALLDEAGDAQLRLARCAGGGGDGRGDRVHGALEGVQDGTEEDAEWAWPF